MTCEIRTSDEAHTFEGDTARDALNAYCDWQGVTQPSSFDQIGPFEWVGMWGTDDSVTVTELS